MLVFDARVRVPDGITALLEAGKHHLPGPLTAEDCPGCGFMHLAGTADDAEALTLCVQGWHADRASHLIDITMTEIELEDDE